MSKANGFGSFSRNFWTAIIMEFFERGSYYSVMSILSVYLILSPDAGGLGFSKEQAGSVLGIIPPLLYLLPIISGAIAERYGYRKVLFFAFLCIIAGYMFAGISATYAMILLSLLVLATGAGFFKPVISGTIARSTNENNSSLGFGIYYWSINLGAFLFPLILVPMLKKISYSYIFYMASIAGIILLLLNIFLYQEPQKRQSDKSLPQVFKEMLLVIKDWKFLLMILIYSGFWILYFQMYWTVLWYVKDYMDMAPINNVVNSFLSVFTVNPSWKFDVEHVTVINAGVIIMLQLVVSNLVKNWKALPTMIIGIGLGTAGMFILSLSSDLGVYIRPYNLHFGRDDYTSEKFISYIGLIAPSDKKALYLGYSFLYGVIGSSVGGFLGSPPLCEICVDNLGNPSQLWMIFSCIGAVSIVSLILYNKIIATKKIS